MGSIMNDWLLLLVPGLHDFCAISRIFGLILTHFQAPAKEGAKMEKIVRFPYN